MARFRKRHIPWVALLTILIVAGFVLLMLTQTNWGRRHVLAFGLDQLASRVHGKVSIENIHGNLLSGARLDKVVITDTAGRPFLRADTVTIRYSMRSLLRRHLELHDVKIVNGIMTLDQPPGEDWNYARIFPVGPPKPHRGPGFGSWVLIRNLSFDNATIVVRATWSPDDKLHGAARERSIAAALSSENRLWVVPVTRGYQSISEFYNVNGFVPVMRVSDPDSANRLFSVRNLSMIALPFRPPAAIVKNLSLRIIMTKDSLLFDSIRFALPRTRGSGVGAYALNGGGARLQLTLPQATFADARFIRPDAPIGNGSLRLAFTSHGDFNHIIASEMNVRAEGATVRGLVDVTTGGPTPLVGPSDVTFAGVTTGLVKRYAPTVPFRAPGTMAGHVKLNGSPYSMRVDGNVAFKEVGGPTSHIVADGQVGQSSGALTARNLRLRFNPLYLSLVHPYAPSVPYRGAITGAAVLTGSTKTGFAMNADVVDLDPKAGRSHILAVGRVEFRDGLTARNLKLRFEPLQMAMVKVFSPTIPFGGTVTGTTTLTGSQRTGFNVIADLVHNSSETGQSHVTANGWVNFVNGATVRGLRLGLKPLQMSVVKTYMPRLPFDGVLTGTTTLTGSMTAKRMSATAMDVTHSGAGGDSRFIGRANMDWGGRGFFDVNVHTPVLALGTVGQFMPSAGLRGTASGNIIARGSLAQLNTDVDLTFSGGNGAMHTRGTFNLKTPAKSYDFTSTLTAFNAGGVTSRAPQTRLTGTIMARGSGVTLATADASFNAHLFGSRAEGTPLVDTAIVRGKLANGLVTVDSGHVRLATARADVSGSFGLLENRVGTLRYSFAIDTLAHFFGPAARDTGVVPQRPLITARKVAVAKRDSARIAEQSEVQRAAVGYPAPPRLVVLDTMPIRRDTIAGSLRAEGTLTGNIKRFDTKGTAEAKHLSYRGNRVGRGLASYTLTGFGTPNASFHLDAGGDTIFFGGFAFDSARTKIDYTGVRNKGAGTADIALFQDPSRDYRLRSDFLLALDEKKATLQNLTMRFDTTKWAELHPAVIGWGKPGVTVDNLEMRSNTGGYLRADGRLPTEGNADLRLDIDNLQLADISGLLQDTGRIGGLFSLHSTLRGNVRAPVVVGDFTLLKGMYGGTSIPDIKARIDYANRDLTTHAELFRNNMSLGVADAHLPINLALKDVTGPRLARNAPLQVEMRADSIPLDMLPSFTTAVSDVRGRIRGNATIRGTLDHPRMEGIANLDLGSLRVNSTGVLYHDILGTVRLRGDTAYVDSIVAQAGGTLRATGTLDIATLTQPGFHLDVTAQDAVLVDNQRGTIRADARMKVEGPYTAVHVTGDVDVKSGVIYAPETRNQRVTNLDDPTLRSVIDTVGLGLDVLPKPNALLQNLKIDVDARIAPDTWARNAQANVEIYTPEDGEPLHIHMDNVRQMPTLEGVINTDRGEYTFAGRNFTITTGSATFLGGPVIDPLVQLTARYQVQRRGVEALVIEIHADGTLRKPRVTLQSNSQPPLAQSDLLSYLAFGQSTSSLLNLQSSSAFGVGNGGLSGIPALAEQQIASVAIGASMEQAVSELQREGTRHGLDVFRVHAGELPAEAAFQGYFQNLVRGTEIEAGKYVMPRLFVEARGRLSSAPGLTLQYRGPLGVTWNAAWEPRYMPTEPSFSAALVAQRVRSVGLLVLWNRRF